MAVLDRNKSPDTLLNNIPVKLQKEYTSYLNSLEKTYSQNSEDAVAEEKTADIAVIVNRAEEFAKKREFYQLHNAVAHAFEKIDALRNSDRLPEQIKSSLVASIDVHKRNLEIISSSCLDLLDLTNYNINSSKKDLKKWAEALENLGDAFEDNLDFFSIEYLEDFRDFIFQILEISQQKDLESPTIKSGKNSYRIRIRNAAGFMCRMIDFEIEEAEAEDREILASITSANHPVFFENRPEIHSQQS
jgi:hypothetical protein